MLARILIRLCQVFNCCWAIRLRNLQAAEEERLRMEDEERRQWESSQGAGPRTEVNCLCWPVRSQPPHGNSSHTLSAA